MTTLFTGRKHPHICEGAHWWWINRVPNIVEKMQLAQTQWFFISCKGLCTHIVQTDPEFQFTAPSVMSMAAKSSDLDDWTSGANLQTECHTPIPSRDQKDLEEMGFLGSAPSCSPSWSPARKPSSGCPNTRHCLGIHMTLTEETGAAPPPPHY